MEELVASVFSSFTRYFMPGLVAIAAVLFAPLLVFDRALVAELTKAIDGPEWILIALVLGYILDAVGAYRWSLCPGEYKRQRTVFAEELAKLTGVPSSDPDQHIAELWLNDESTYERIFRERAEWVLILESSFALSCGAAVSFAVAALCARLVCGLREIGLGAILLMLSFVASEKGIQRMKAHNVKLLAAISGMRKQQLGVKP